MSEKAVEIGRIHYSSYGKTVDNEQGCGVVVRGDQSEWDKLLGAEYLFMGNLAIYTFDKSIRNVYSMADTFHNVYNLEFPKNMGLTNDKISTDKVLNVNEKVVDGEFPNCCITSWSFTRIGIHKYKTENSGCHFGIRFPKVTRISKMFYECKYTLNTIGSADGDMFTSVREAIDAFSGCYFKSFGTDKNGDNKNGKYTINFENLYVASNMFDKCTNLTDLYATFPKLICGDLMFKGCKLNAASVKRLLDGLKNPNTNLEEALETPTLFKKYVEKLKLEHGYGVDDDNKFYNEWNVDKNDVVSVIRYSGKNSSGKVYQLRTHYIFKDFITNKLKYYMFNDTYENNKDIALRKNNAYTTEEWGKLKQEEKREHIIKAIEHIFKNYDSRPVLNIYEGDIGKITIGIDCANNETRKNEFAKSVNSTYTSWAKLKEAFEDKGWNVTWEFNG